VNSDVNVSMALPPKPTVFHGRDEYVNDAVWLLVAHTTARLAVLGSGGMGKTTVALAILYNPQIAEYFGIGRLFLSCEALVDADSIVVSLAKLLSLPASTDLLTTVVAHLAAISHVLLVLDNLETVWLVDGAPVHAVEELLGRLAQIPSLSLIITCRGISLPQFVRWSNTDTTALEPFSLDAALETFQDRAGRRLNEEDLGIAKQLLDAIDRMPLAVSLLGQLAQRGNSVSELLARWNREHSALLQTHDAGRINNVEISIEVSILMLCAADKSEESLQLLALCSMLPDGLRPDVFEKLRPHFKRIDRARDNLTAYALASLGADRVLKTLSPIRHLVLERHPASPSHRDALHSVYFDIAEQLPLDVNERYKGLAVVAAPELNNLSSLLLALVSQPSHQIVDVVLRFTHFAYLQQPNLTVVSALLLHLDPHPGWNARCLLEVSYTQIHIGEYRAAIDSLNTAKRLFLEVGDRSGAAQCAMDVAEPHRLLDEYDRAEMELKEAQKTCAELGDERMEADCRLRLGILMRQKHDYPAAIEHLSAARQTFSSFGKQYAAFQCSEYLGMVYLDQGNLESAGVELEVARAAFINFGDAHQTPQCSLVLGMVRRKQGNLALAEQLLKEAAVQYNKSGEQLGLASCEKEFGYLRYDQGRLDEAITHFDSAWRLYKSLHIQEQADGCRECVEWLKSTARTVDDSVQLALP